jgi:citrate lyase subunit beta / citryl-CoA lyase
MALSGARADRQTCLKSVPRLVPSNVGLGFDAVPFLPPLLRRVRPERDLNPVLHPRTALFSSEKPLPSLAVCEHIAGSERFLGKALQLQADMGPLFDITGDCEDGAAAGAEKSHAQMIAQLIASAGNRFARVGARIHDLTNPSWTTEAEILIGQSAKRLAYLTLPKANSVSDVSQVLDFIARCATRNGWQRPITLHVMIETQGALRDVQAIATLPGVETLDFGIMDFVSSHQGAISAKANRSPGQFEHRLIVRAKAEIAAAALANAVVPTHNVTLALNQRSQVFDDALRARREFGFLRMWSIHPSQIEPIIDALRPDYAEVGNAAEVLLAAAAANWAPIRYLDELYDRASYRYYWQILERARATGMEIPSAAEAAFY